MKRIIFLLFISSQSLFSQNTTTVNTKVNVMGMDIMDVQVQETNTTNSNSNQQQVGSVPQNQNNGGQSKPSSCTFPISGSEYGKVTATIKSQSFEETQLQKQIV
jgi:hypothetical protein